VKKAFAAAVILLVVGGALRTQLTVRGFDVTRSPEPGWQVCSNEELELAPTSSNPVLANISPAAVTAANCTHLGNWQCVETRSGLSLCRANNICVVKVDLNNSTIRPRVVIAPGGGTAWLSSMAAAAGALAAINGDYFSGCPDGTPPLNCGEGLTFVDGVDYTDYTGSEWQNRRSLGFSDGYDPNIGWPGEHGSYHRYLLGGGPQVTFDGEYRWRCWYQGYNTEGNCTCQGNIVVINDELFGCSANNWWNRPQTFIGFSDDRNTLYLARSEPGYNKTPHEMHDVLWVYGARRTLKMDGGGSSGMYFNDGGYQFGWNGSRAVASAWVIVPESSPSPTSTPLPFCNPQHPVELWEHASCSGAGLLFPGAGWWNLTDYSFNDIASSIGVQSGWSAKLWLDTDRQPANCYKCLTASDSDFGGDSFDGGCGTGLNDQASSIEVFHNTSCAPSCDPNADQVALYADTGYGGSCVTLNVGDYPNPGYLGDLGNDNAESIKVGGNVQATLCEHDDYQGRCETFTGDDSNLGDNTIGANVVSSVRVQSRTQPPSAPALQSPGNGSAFNEGDSITLSWSDTGDEYYGEVWGGPGGTLTFGWQSGTSKNIGSQWAGYTYSWHVKARNGAGEGGWSDTWTFTVRPAAPSNLSAQTASCSAVNLYWDDNSGNEEGYKIYRSGSYVGQVGMNTTSYQDTGLSENTGYSYYVKAFRGSVESDASNTVNITTPSCPAGPLVYDAHTIDDDDSGESNGDGDGVVECGESIELNVTLRNMGSSTATGVNATISTGDPYVTWLYNTDSGYPDIAGGGTGSNNNDFDFAVDPNTPDGHIIHFDLDITAANGGPWSASFDVPVLACDTVPPTGRITSPPVGAVVGDCPLTIQAEASDDDSGVGLVEFHAWYDNGWHHLGDDSTNPYSWNWDCSSVGDQDVWLTIHIWDNAGNEVMDPGGYVYIVLDRSGFRVFLPCVMRRTWR